MKEQVAIYDEIHISQVCGYNKEKTISFAKNDEDGEINEEEEQRVSFVHCHYIYSIKQQDTHTILP